MSKRLNKRQQREAEELAQLGQGVQVPEATEEPEEPQEDEKTGIDNLFAALTTGDRTEEADGTEDEEEEEEDELNAVATPKKKKKSKKKKKKATVVEAEEEEPVVTSTKKKAKAKTHDEDDDLDKILAEHFLQQAKENPASSSTAGPSSTSQFGSTRTLLSVDPKNLDADAELRKFFGSKVVASSSSGQNAAQARRQAQLNKLRTTLAKPKLTWPPPTALNGLAMREIEFKDGIRTFSFEHSGAWREAQRQFIGATRSHDPNQLFALLQVFPWHVDTLLQMSEVYRLQSDIGAASDYAERALYAFDRCLIPAFNITSGTCRLDFRRVENRAMFLALHRNIAYLGRRGCWVTAFTFAKLLFALDPHGDPHCAVLWLDFLAIKTGNAAWLLQTQDDQEIGHCLRFYPGMAYARALAIRETDPSKGDEALRDAIHAFPEVVPVLADKIGATIPSAVRADARFQIRAGYEENSETSLHLLAHLYVSRSDALWKEEGRAKWLSAQVELAYNDMPKPGKHAIRAASLTFFNAKESLPMRQSLCRHVLVTESTSYLGFLPPSVTQRPMVSYDPEPPRDGVSFYDNAYFSGQQISERSMSPAAIHALVDKYQAILVPKLLNKFIESYPREDVNIEEETVAPVVIGMIREMNAAGASGQDRQTATNMLLERLPGMYQEVQDLLTNLPVPGAFPA